MPARLGEYCVGDLRFLNRYDALFFATQTNQSVTWDFNEAVFSCFDWTVPITENLDELYRQRAQQIRDKYDYVSLFFSGGVDSTNILHAFIDNDIQLDEVVMFKPKSHIHNPNATVLSDNLYSELDFAALPHLRKHADGKGIKVRTIYLEDAFSALLKNDTYASQFHKLNALVPNHLARVAMAVTDPEWAALYDAGKNVAHVQGIDKPYVKLKNEVYSFYFREEMTTLAFEPEGTNELAEKIKKHQHHEFFYWTPDLPKLVIKQAQIAKKFYMVNPDSIGNNDVLVNYLYPPHVVSIRNLFNAGKATWGANGNNQQWIHSPEITYAKGVFVDMLSIARTIIDAKFTDPDYNIRAARPKAGSYKIIPSKEYRL
jgi:hypothetical protein